MPKNTSRMIVKALAAVPQTEEIEHRRLDL